MTRLTLQKLIDSLPDPKPTLLPPPPDEIIVDQAGWNTAIPYGGEDLLDHLDEDDESYIGSCAWHSANAILKAYPTLDPRHVVDNLDRYIAGDFDALLK